MSSFDKEAEREKLRKQFEKEEEQRASTQHLSELLLQGVTMTNRHCGECGDPIFRQQDKLFCPTCDKPVQAESADTPPSDSEHVPDTDQDADLAADTTTQASSTVSNDGQATSIDTMVPEPDNTEGTTPETATHSADPNRSVSQRTDTSDLVEAQRSLVRTITQFTKEAETTNDVRRARDLLAATKDAADALSAIQSLPE